MRRRKLVIALAAAAMFGLLSVPASAELHRVTVTPDQRPDAHADGRRPGGPVGRDDPDPEPAGAGRQRSPTSARSRPRRRRPRRRRARRRPQRPPRPRRRRRRARPGRPAAAPRRRARRPRRRPPPRPRAGTRARTRSSARASCRTRPIRSTLDPNAESLDGKVGGRAEREDAPATTPIPDPQQPTQNTDGSPTLDNPTVSLATPGPGADRRPELLHREVPHPAVPAPDLPGRRHRVRRALGGARRDQRDRDRLRPQPQRLLRRRARLDAVHARDLGDVRRRRQPATASRTRTTRSTRSSPPRATCAPPAPSRTCARAIFAYNHADWYVDSVILRARYIGGLPADLVGSLSGLTQGRFPVQAKATYAEDAARKTQGQGRQPRLRRRVERPPQRHPDLRQAPAPRSSRSTTAASSAPATAAGSATSSCCRTSTATRTPTGTSKSVVERYPTPKPQAVDDKQVAARAASCRRATPRPTRPPPRRRRPRRASAQRRQSARARKAKAAPRPRTTARPRRSACSPTRTARTPRPRAATQQVRRRARRRLRQLPQPASSGSTAPTST